MQLAIERIIEERQSQLDNKHAVEFDAELYPNEELLSVAKWLLCDEDDAEKENYEEYIFHDEDGLRLGHWFLNKAKQYDRTKSLTVAAALIAAQLDIHLLQQQQELKT